MDVIRIVLASPTDLLEERKMITTYINNKDKQLKRSNITLDLRRWEDTSPGTNAIGGQGTIDNDLEIEKADIFICLYWKRFGTIIEGLNEAGTEHELNVAIESYKKTGKPNIKFFLKTIDINDFNDDINRINEMVNRVKPLALYKEFETLDVLRDSIDKIVTDEVFARLEKVFKNPYIKPKYIEVNRDMILTESIKSGQSLILHNEYYNILSNAVNTDFVTIENVFDGQEVVLNNVSDFTILGDNAKIVTSPRYATVLTFKNCHNISLSSLSIGHTPHKGYCDGAVLRFENCEKVRLDNMELFGCGTYGIELVDCSDFSLNGSHIFDCTYGAVIMHSSDLLITNSLITDCNKIVGCIFELYSSYMRLENVSICNNETDNSVFAIDESNVYGNAVNIYNNKYANLGLDTDLEGFNIYKNLIIK